MVSHTGISPRLISVSSKEAGSPSKEFKTDRGKVIHTSHARKYLKDFHKSPIHFFNMLNVHYYLSPFESKLKL